MSNELQSIGLGHGSRNEATKLESNLLRGALASVLGDATSHLDDDSVQLLKFHGSYQEDDRDQRRARREAGLEKAYEFMVRSRIPGGSLTAEQYLAHDQLAHRYGNGSLRLTTRQGIQLHGVLKGNLIATIRAINDALLSTLAACGDVNRNVMACPAPVQSRVHAQVQEYAYRIAMHLAPRTHAYHELWLGGEQITAPEEEPIYGKTYLPRKFKIGVAFPGDNCVDVFTQDIGLVADVQDAQLLGFTITVGGGMGSTHGKAETYPRLGTPLCFVCPENVLAVAESIVETYRDYGDRENRKHARMKYLVEERGIEWFRAELQRRRGVALSDPHAIRFDGVCDHLGWHRQADDRWFLGLHVDSGRVVDGPFKLLRSGLRHVVESFSPGLRITGQQNVLLTDIAATQRAEIETLLQSYGIETKPSELGIRRTAMACPALPTCGLAVAEAERALPGILEKVEGELAALGLEHEAVSIRMTGCPNGCARPRMSDIGIVGRSLDLYDIYIGGDAANTRLNELYAQSIRSEALVEALHPALELWRSERSPGESFGDFAHRRGIAKIASAPPTSHRTLPIGGPTRNGSGTVVDSDLTRR
jgi:sulfite reductase (ferredoxin)